LWARIPSKAAASHDSTVATDVERVLGGVQPHLMVTDPPYPLLISGVRLGGHDRLARHDALTAEKLNFSAGAMTAMVSETARPDRCAYSSRSGVRKMFDQSGRLATP